MGKYFVVADHHFGHHAIMEYCKRPWTNVDKMDRDLVKLHNSIVTPTDTTFFLGDVTLRGAENIQWLRRIIHSMNGRKILVFGNHDQMHYWHYLEAGFESCHTSYELDGPSFIAMAHDPCVAQDPSRLWICGHLHNVAFSAPTHICIVSVELTDYKPVALNDIITGWRPK